MTQVLDTTETRLALDRFTDAYVQERSEVIGARVLADEQGAYLAITIRPGADRPLPEVFEGLPVRVVESTPGSVAAGPVR